MSFEIGEHVGDYEVPLSDQVNFRAANGQVFPNIAFRRGDLTQNNFAVG